MRILAMAFVLAGLALWIPASVFVPLRNVRTVSPRPAGEITAGFRLVQQVPDGVAPAQHKGAVCFAVRFATYMRRNRGYIAVSWRQGAAAQQWQVPAGDLVDNALRYFCPQSRFDPSKSFAVAIEGVDGKPSRAATVWLTGNTDFGRADLRGEVIEGGMQMALARHVRLTPRKLIELDHGAFVVGWLCSMLTGIAALFWARRP